MKLIVNPKTKKQEKAVKSFLSSLDIEFSKVEEDQAVYETTSKKSFSQKEKKILDNLDRSVDFVNKYKKGRTKGKGSSKILHTAANEDMALAMAMEKGRRTKLLSPDEKKSFLKKIKSAK